MASPKGGSFLVQHYNSFPLTTLQPSLTLSSSPILSAFLFSTIADLVLINLKSVCLIDPSFRRRPFGRSECKGIS
ncbi:hypothetical protein K2173_023513 [Erythroxylum novogranatense]|uniref:Uncharacterized protein n=1 Tax=Erythroxylum novogranatense TaxID=1862640 RepID=A0AAV8TR63_9ROSI|nr:hypothetical protein K2173_023513 [Erythroxylum novogranatense]